MERRSRAGLGVRRGPKCCLVGAARLLPWTPWTLAQSHLNMARIALETGVAVNFLRADLDTWQPQAKAYDLIIGFRFLNRKLWPRVWTALRPGGWLVYQTFNARKLTPDADFTADYLLDLGEMAAHVCGLAHRRIWR